MEKFSYSDAKILVVDDIEQVLISTKNCLEFEDMNVECISNPVEALEYLKTHQVDVLLLDFFMPEMNGDEFVEKLREFNQETIVILQTGYSDKIPPLEMIDRMNIQGYLDKLKGEDELILMTKAAIKTSYLNKMLRQKDAEINFLKYKKSILGGLITQLINESVSQVFSISCASSSIMNSTEDYNDELDIINRANSSLANLFKALNFESAEEMNINEYKNTLQELLNVKLKMKAAKFELIESEGVLIIPKKIDILTYIIIEVVTYLLEKDVKDIKVLVNKVGDAICFKVDVQAEYADNIKSEIQKLADNDANIEVAFENELVVKLI